MIYVVYPITSPIWKAGVIFTYCNADCRTFELMTNLSLNKVGVLHTWARAAGYKCLSCKHFVSEGSKPITRCRILKCDGDCVHICFAPRPSMLRCALRLAPVGISRIVCSGYEEAATTDGSPFKDVVLSLNRAAAEGLLSTIEEDRRLCRSLELF